MAKVQFTFDYDNELDLIREHSNVESLKKGLINCYQLSKRQLETGPDIPISVENTLNLIRNEASVVYEME